MSHYLSGKTVDEYSEEYKAAEKLVFGKAATTVTYAVLDSLDGIVDIGKGCDAQEAKEDYLVKIDMLIAELEEARGKIMYDEVALEYMPVKEM